LHSVNHILFTIHIFNALRHTFSALTVDVGWAIGMASGL